MSPDCSGEADAGCPSGAQLRIMCGHARAHSQAIHRRVRARGGCIRSINANGAGTHSRIKGRGGNGAMDRQKMGSGCCTDEAEHAAGDSTRKGFTAWSAAQCKAPAASVLLDNRPQAASTTPTLQVLPYFALLRVRVCSQSSGIRYRSS
jgi:hypothetical protein